MRRLLMIGAAVVALLAVTIVAVPPLIDLGAYKARFLPFAEQALNRKVDVGEIRLRLLPVPAIRLSNLRVADDPAFSETPLFTARALSLRLKLAPLFRGKLDVQEFILESPVFNLVKRADGAFNFADIAKKKEQAPRKEKPARGQRARAAARWPQVAPAMLRIEGGALTLRAPGQKPLEIHGIDIALENFAADRPFRYRLALQAEDLKPVTVAGQMLYQPAEATLTLRDSLVKAEGIDFEINGAVSGLAGTPEARISIANDGFEIKPLVELLAKMKKLPDGFTASGVAGLRILLTGPSNNLLAQVEARFKGVDVDAPRAFKGSVAGELAVAAPLAGDQPLVRRLRGGGRLAANDGALTNVDFAKTVEQAFTLAGLSERQPAPTSFRALTTDFTVAAGIADLKRIYVDTAILEGRGSGRLALQPQTVDIALQAALAPALSARVASARRASFSTDGRGRAVVPLRITGPLTRPAVRIDGGRTVPRRAGAAPAAPRPAPREPSIFERLFSTRQESSWRGGR